MERGVTLSLATELEVRLAEKLVELIPCAEMVRFGKNGSDATTGAIRVARAYTGRDRVAVCGYHGWQDWYIGSTPRHKGVPKAVRELTHSFPYNDLGALEDLLKRYSGQFAAVILEPMTTIEPAQGYLEGVKTLAHRHGALLVFDEIITGFRFHLGGAQALFGVTPDLAAFGKSLGNGFPIAAVVGRRDVMHEMEEIFFSSTFGGECVSLAAALAVAEKMQREPVIQILWERGATLLEGVRALIERHELSDTIGVGGKPCWSMLQIKDTPRYSAWQIRTLLVQEILSRGVLTSGTQNMCYAHTSADIGGVIAVYREAFGILEEALREGTLERYLRSPAMKPIFRVRG
jgi:glutamate-1-semialdehyde aminotransferase